MSPGLPKRIGLAALLLLLPGCSPGTVATTTSGATSTTTVPGTMTTTATLGTTTTTTAGGSVTVLLAPFSEMGPGWVEQVFPYGEGEEFLGTSPGGEGGSIDLGPEYGTQTADGTWWFLDAARLRLAHFAGDGNYLDQLLVPGGLLVDGQYFQFQMPQALNDGSLAVGGFDRPLLRVVDGEISGLAVDNGVPWATTDGEYLYGFSPEDSALVRLHPDNPVIETVEWFAARDESRYRVTVIEDELLVELPDTGVTTTLRMRFSEDPQVIARAGIEVETGADGTIFIMFYGAPSSDETIGVGGIVAVAPDGSVGETETIVNPFSMSDPGSPAHLGITPDTSNPWVMVVGVDGVHVYNRSD